MSFGSVVVRSGAVVIGGQLDWRVSICFDRRSRLFRSDIMDMALATVRVQDVRCSVSLAMPSMFEDRNLMWCFG